MASVRGEGLVMLDVLRAILVDLGISDDLLRDDAQLRSDLKFDTAETVELALEVRKRLGVAVGLESKQEISLGKLSSLITRAQSGPTGHA